VQGVQDLRAFHFWICSEDDELKGFYGNGAGYQGYQGLLYVQKLSSSR
jgi:hypothetical protein